MSSAASATASSDSLSSHRVALSSDQCKAAMEAAMLHDVPATRAALADLSAAQSCNVEDLQLNSRWMSYVSEDVDSLRTLFAAGYVPSGADIDRALRQALPQCSLSIHAEPYFDLLIPIARQWKLRSQADSDGRRSLRANFEQHSFSFENDPKWEGEFKQAQALRGRLEDWLQGKHLTGDERESEVEDDAQG